MVGGGEVGVGVCAVGGGVGNGQVVGGGGYVFIGLIVAFIPIKLNFCNM